MKPYHFAITYKRENKAAQKWQVHQPYHTINIAIDIMLACAFKTS